MYISMPIMRRYWTWRGGAHTVLDTGLREGVPILC